MQPLTRQEAANALIARRLARQSLVAFAQKILPSYQAAVHHKLIASKLEAVERGEIKRLALFLPPRSGKSLLSSQLFPAWYMGRNPTAQLVTASYSTDLARGFGRNVRNIVNSNDFAAVFPDVKLADDSKAADAWHTNHGGVYVATGVGAGLTGKGANCSIIDDPIRDRQDADSEVIRDKIWDWYSSVLYTRRMPGGSIILCLTRWHEQDLAGRLLQAQQNGGDQWDVVSLPAIANEHTPQERALWPEWYPLEDLRRTRAVMMPRDWQALYQQNPTPDEGGFFKRDWFGRFHENGTPQRRNVYMSSDFAVTDGSGDYTEHGVWGLAPDDTAFALDWWRGQTTADVWIETALDFIEKHKPLAWFCEAGVIRRAIEPFLIKRMRERKVYCRIVWLASISDKATRARAFQARAAMGKVRLPREPWADRLLDQLATFPAGEFDDGVDTCSIFARGLEDIHAATLAPQPKQRHNDRWIQPTAPENNWKVL